MQWGSAVVVEKGKLAGLLAFAQTLGLTHT